MRNVQKMVYKMAQQKSRTQIKVEARMVWRNHFRQQLDRKNQKVSEET